MDPELMWLFTCNCIVAFVYVLWLALVITYIAYNKSYND